MQSMGTPILFRLLWRILQGVAPNVQRARLLLEIIRTKLFHNVELVRQQQSDDAIERLHELLFRHERLIADEHGIPGLFSLMNCGVRKKSLPPRQAIDDSFGESF